MIAVEPIIARALGIGTERISDDLMYQSIPEWDSLRHVALMIALEKHLGTQITDRLMIQLHSVGAIREFAKACAANGGEAVETARPSPAMPADELKSINVCRGLEGVYVDRSSITHIDGERGLLEHCGYNIQELAEQSSFEETAWLLLTGELPDAGTLKAFTKELCSHRRLPDPVIDLVRALAHAHPMEVLRTGVSALGALTSDARDESQEAATRAGIRLIAQVPTLISTHHAIRRGREPVAPRQTGSHAENFLFMLFGEEPAPGAVRLVDKDLILHADHGSNASAFAARVAISCQANLHAAITAAIAAFSGPLHGGAAERVNEFIDAVGAPENAAAYVRERLDSSQPVMGFGHRVYRTSDPRVHHQREAVREISRGAEAASSVEVVEAIIDAMKPYARHGVGPNVDLYAGVEYRLLGLPDDLAVPMFVAGRIAGWVAQALEQKSNNVLIRPLLQYVGARSRKYTPLSERKSGDTP
ncbi:MAG TPA: citrate/2-methylcitrate synthase [Blastocatellia bacterium]|jgi:citrate synthase